MANIKKFNEYALNTNILDIIREFKMDEYLNILLKENKSNYAPYHNINHLLCVTKYCYLFGKEEGVSKKELRVLVTAGLFHDFNHSEGKKTDDKNIAEAKKCVEKYVDSDDIEDVNVLIEATQYPYVIDVKDLSLSQKIIRDADFMQTFEDNFIHQVVFGLAKEIGKEPIDFLSMQKSFISSMEFNTNTAKKYTKSKLEKLEDNVDYLIKITK